MQTTSSYGITRDFARKFTEMVGPDLDKHPGAIDNLFGSFCPGAPLHCLLATVAVASAAKEVASDLNGGTNGYLCSMTDPTPARIQTSRYRKKDASKATIPLTDIS